MVPLVIGVIVFVKAVSSICTLVHNPAESIRKEKAIATALANEQARQQTTKDIPMTAILLPLVCTKDSEGQLELDGDDFTLAQERFEGIRKLLPTCSKCKHPVLDLLTYQGVTP